jgi:hypothetical protein
MIVTEHGLRFRRDGHRWRCVEHPELLMFGGVGCFVLAGEEDRTFSDVNEALACLKRDRAVE